MRRTQIYLTEELYKKLIILRKIRQISFAQIIRELLEKYLDKEKIRVSHNLKELSRL